MNTHGFLFVFIASFLISSVISSAMGENVNLFFFRFIATTILGIVIWMILRKAVQMLGY